MRPSMHKFVELSQRFPDVRKADARKQDFLEIEAPFDKKGCERQSSRCEQCAVPFCQTYCPVGNDIPDWLMLCAEGDWREAWERLSAVNALPEICGRICPQDRLCEGNCVLERGGHGTVTIGAVEKTLTEHAFSEGWITPLRPRRERSAKVAIVGSGPAGLSAATRLRELGYQVRIFEAQDRAGGLMIYGIPNFKLDKHIVERRVRWLQESGVSFTLDCRIGKDKSFAELRASYDVVLLATGVYDARRLSLEGEEGEGVLAAFPYLKHSDRLYLGDKIGAEQRQRWSAAGRRVVVLGGGDTAMDCVRTAQRQGAKSVLCLYRRDRDSMPGSRREVQKAEEEGVVFRFLTRPTAIVKGKGAGKSQGKGEEQTKGLAKGSALRLELGRVEGVRVQKMRLVQKGKDGRAKVLPVEGEEEELPCDCLVKALGFEAEDLPTLFAEPALPTTEWGTLRVSKPDMRSALDNVFAAGDIVRGASLVVWAVREGMDAARGIDATLEQRAAVQTNDAKKSEAKKSDARIKDVA